MEKTQLKKLFAKIKNFSKKNYVQGKGGKKSLYIYILTNESDVCGTKKTIFLLLFLV